MTPDFVRYVDQKNGIYVLELPPAMKLINLRDGGGWRTARKVLIPVPWQVYLCQPKLNFIQFFTRTERLRSFSDVLNYPHISNIYRDCSPCMGIPLSQTCGRTDIERAIAHINYIWESSFQGGFYLSEQGSHYVHHALLNEKRKNLLPPTMIEHMGGKSLMYFQGGIYDEDRNSGKYYDWLETLTPDDLLQWEWIKAGKLRDLLRKPPAAGVRLQRPKAPAKAA